MKPRDYERLEQTIEWMEREARAMGLDFFDMRYEICPTDVVYTIAGFGMPTRYSHWSFGKQYYRQKLDFDLGVSRIYELVVNSDPCYAFLLEGNTVLQNEMIVAHVLGHSDFFRHNCRFQYTNRSMVDSMAAAAQRIRRYEESFGIDRVEEVLDAALSVQEHVDASILGRKPNEDGAVFKDLLGFIVHHSRQLEDWERDIVASVREEMLYFWPQLETKVMNEGWATYWHTKLMQARDLSGQDAVDFAQLTASVAQPNRFNFNPYNVGLVIWQDIERRYGRDKLFEVRECDSDVSFLRNYLNQDIVDECDLYVYGRRGSEWVVIERDAAVIRDLLVQQRTNAGFPVLHASEEAEPSGRLLISHAYEGQELDVKYIERTLPMVYRLWGRPVSLKTVLNGHAVEFAYDGTATQRKAV